MNNDLQALQKEIQDEYGTIDINIQTGEINYEDAKTD
jgi:hypothetical protein